MNGVVVRAPRSGSAHCLLFFFFQLLRGKSSVSGEGGEKLPYMTDYTAALILHAKNDPGKTLPRILGEAWSPPVCACVSGVGSFILGEQENKEGGGGGGRAPPTVSRRKKHGLSRERKDRRRRSLCKMHRVSATGESPLLSLFSQLCCARALNSMQNAFASCQRGSCGPAAAPKTTHWASELCFTMCRHWMKGPVGWDFFFLFLGGDEVWE